MGNKKDMYDLLDEEIAALDISEEQKKALKKLNYVNKKHLTESIKQNQQREKKNSSMQQAQSSFQEGDFDCYMIFDGKNLGLYKNQEQIGNLEAQSGQDNFQSAKYQHIQNKGPIPEGTYYADQEQRQNITALDAVIGTGVGLLSNLGLNINKSKWKGGPVAWGLRRVWLEPGAKTNTHGRSGFSIHGGFSKGSAGCIDIPWQTKKLSDYLDDCQQSVPVRVKYPKNW